MRCLLSSVLVTCLLGASGCSLLFDGSRFQGGLARDASVDVGPAVDTGVPTDAFRADADIDASGPACTTDMECPAADYCAGDVCKPCDGDGDNFASASAGIRALRCVSTPHTDCDDANAEVYPGHRIVCGNTLDDGCSEGAGRLIPDITELGYLRPVAIPSMPMDADLDEVQVFARSPTQAVAFTHLLDSRQTPLVAEVLLGETGSGMMMSLSTWLGAPDFDAMLGTSIYAAAIRIGDEVRISELHVVDSMLMTTGSWSLVGAAAPVSAGGASFVLGGSGTPVLPSPFMIAGQPMLVSDAAGMSLSWGAPSMSSGSGLLYALPTTGGSPSVIADEVGAAGRRSANSSQGFGIITHAGDATYYLWDGHTSGAAGTTLWAGAATAGVMGRGVVVTMDPAGTAGGPYALVGLPVGANVELQLVRCEAVNTCTVVSSSSFATGGGALALAAVTDSVVAFLAESDSPDRARFGIVDLNATTAWTLPATIVPILVPTPGVGEVRALSLDQQFTGDATVPGAGTATVAYAYLRDLGTGGSHPILSIGAVQACVGYMGL